MQAIMLAAGMGKRLGKYTNNNTKCMVKIQDKTLIERAIEALLDNNINKLIMVVGYKRDNLKKYLLEECNNPRIKEMQIEFIDNDIYDKTNNIYSLYLAKDELSKEDTILLESDLIYDSKLIEEIVKSKDKNVVSVAKYKQWMDGTVVTIDENKNVVEFIEKRNFDYNKVDSYYKTVNIYKLSKEFCRKEFVPFLNAFISTYGENEYYELVLKIIAHLSRSQLKALDISNIDWYEIDDAQDYDIASCIFSTGKQKLELFQKKYGGYWRFDRLLDYCYLVNPYFPPKKMLDQINYFSKELITQYPSGQSVECINASRLFNNVLEQNLCVGNGAAELINALGRTLKGKMYLSKSVFHEYVRCFSECDFSLFDMKDNNYRFNVGEIKNNIKNNDIICLVNPDNPTGAFIKHEEIIPILDECEKQGKICIFDESFIDFANEKDRYTLISNEILEKYKNLIIIKSISKSYGVPGIRLGIMATSNEKIMASVKKYISIWNINSYGEYFLQIINLYKKEYIESCNLIALERERFINELKKISGIQVYSSEANYVFCYLETKDSTEVATQLLEKNIFIKDLKTKDAFQGQNYIRLAIRTKEENTLLVMALQEILENKVLSLSKL